MTTTAAPPSGTPAPQIGAGTTTNPPAEQTPTNPPSSSASPTGGVSFAGKFKDQQAFESGLSAIYEKNVGLKFNGKWFGEGGQFADPKAAEEWYKGQERLMHSSRQPEKKPEQQPSAANPLQIAKPPEPDLDADYDPYEIIASANLKIDDLAKQWQEKGDLTDEQYKALQGARKNLGKADIKALARGMIAEHAAKSLAYNNALGKAVERAGGQETLGALIKWAETGLNAKQQQAVNAQLADPDLINDAVDFLKFKYAETNGMQSDSARGSATSGPANLPKSKEELGRLMYSARMGDVSSKRLIDSIPIDQWNALIARFQG